MRAAHLLPRLGALHTGGVVTLCVTVMLTAACAAAATEPSQPTNTSVPPTATERPTARPPSTPVRPQWVIDFAQPILDDIRSRPPDFQDTFDLKSPHWVEEPECRQHGKIEIGGGKLLISNCPARYTAADFTDYVIEVDAAYEAGEHEQGGVLIEFRDRACGFAIGWNSFVFAECGRDDTGVNARKGIQMKNYRWKERQAVTMLLIVKGPRFGFYIDGKPADTFRDDRFAEGGWVLGGLGQLGPDVYRLVSFDNLKVWDITGLVLP